MGRILELIHKDCKGHIFPCPCICGCDAPPGCDCFDVYCGKCHLQIVRGNEPHGQPNEENEAEPSGARKRS